MPDKAPTLAQQIAQHLRDACKTDPAVFLDRLVRGEVRADIEDRRRSTVLHHLAKKGRLPAFLEVMAHPTRPAVRRANLDGDTALHHAASGGHLAIVRTLIAAGADVNQRNNQGKSALHEAAQAWHPEVVSALLAAGATPDQRHEGPFKPSMSEVSPLAYTLYKESRDPKETLRQLDTMRRLLDAGADPDWPRGHLVMPNLHRSIGKPVAALKLLLDHGADPNLRFDHRGTTALMTACEYGLGPPAGKARARAAVDLLIARGADVTLADEKGWTALHMAVRHNDASLINVLLTAGADPLARSLDGKTPMDAATLRVGDPPEAAILALAMAEATLDQAPVQRPRPRL